MNEFADAIQDETIEQPAIPGVELPRDTYFERIEEDLTDEQKGEKRVRLEAVDREIIRLEEEKAAATKVFNNQIKPLKAERESILDTLNSGTESREVEVYEHFVKDSVHNIVRVEVRRVDTDKVIEERAATDAEQRESAEDRQGNLFDGDSNPPPGLRDPADDEDEDEASESAVGPEDFEPTPEAIAQAAEDEQRVVRTSSKEAKAKKKAREQAASEKATDAE